MARPKPHKEGNLMETQTVSASGIQGQDQKYDPSLVSLFAQSVSRVPNQSNRTQSIDIVPVGSSENCRQTKFSS